MRLPNEDDLQKLIREDLGVELQIASDLLDVGTGIFKSGDVPNPEEEVDHLEPWVCLGIIAKACRQYRAVVALVEISLGEIAMSNCRMLAETMLAAEFLMRSSVSLRRGAKPVPEVPGYPLTTAFRTKLYLAHDAATELKTTRGMIKHGPTFPTDTDRVLKEAERYAKEMIDEIGPEWAERQKAAGSYSGLKVLELADSLDLIFLYDVFYRPSSAGVHGTDAKWYIDVDELADGTTTYGARSSNEAVPEALSFSTQLLGSILRTANHRFGFGIEDKLADIESRIEAVLSE
jgi:hypothetical protein